MMMVRCPTSIGHGLVLVSCQLDEGVNFILLSVGICFDVVNCLQDQQSSRCLFPTQLVMLHNFENLNKRKTEEKQVEAREHLYQQTDFC